MPTTELPTTLSPHEQQRLHEVATQLGESWWGSSPQVLDLTDLADNPRFRSTALPRLHYHDPAIGDDVWVATDLYHRPDGSATREATTHAPMAPFLAECSDVLRDRHGVVVVTAHSEDVVTVYPVGGDLYLWQIHYTHNPATPDVTRLYLSRSGWAEPIILAHSYGGQPGDAAPMMSAPCDRATLDHVVTYVADNVFESPAERREHRLELRERFLATDCTYADAWALMPNEVEDPYALNSTAL